MDYNLFIKNKFLNQSMGDFSTTYNKVDYSGLEKMVSKNTIFGMGKVAMRICRKNVKSVFDSIDGLPLNQDAYNSGKDAFLLTRKDGYVDRDELYQLIKDSFKLVNGKEITDEEISKMTVREAIDLVIEYLDQKQTPQK